MVSLLAMGLVYGGAAVGCSIAGIVSTRASENLVDRYQNQWILTRQREAREVQQLREQRAASLGQAPPPPLKKKDYKKIEKQQKKATEAPKPVPMIQPEEYFDVSRE